MYVDTLQFLPRIYTFVYEVSEIGQIIDSESTFNKTVLLLHYEMVKVDGQLFADIFSEDLGTGREEQNRPVIVSTKATVTFMNGDDECLFLQAKKTRLIDSLDGNHGWGRGNGLPGFN